MGNDSVSHQSQELLLEIESYLHRLFPITRSITGPGNRKTLKILQEIAPIKIKEYSSGTPVYDWIIPEEWHIRDAWIKNSSGHKIIDFQKSNIHIVSYSEPVNKKISFEELKKKLYTNFDLPSAIPYRTTYYNRDWGFCITPQQYKELEEEEETLEVFIDSEFLSNGSSKPELQKWS